MLGIGPGGQPTSPVSSPPVEVRGREVRSSVSAVASARVQLLALSGTLLLFTSPIAAQDFERIAPHTPPAGEGGSIGLPGELPDPAAEGAEVELLPALKGLVFVPRVDDVRVDGHPGVSGILVEEVDLMDEAEWRDRLSRYLGARFTMADLNAVMREVILYFREAGRPVVDVVIVEQDITAGVVQLAVVEAMLGEVRAEGARHFNADRLAGQVRLVPGEPIYSTLLMADLAWLNRNPFRSVDLVYSPGEADATSDVVLRINDRFPMRVYGGYEDSGNALTGDNRWLAGVNYGNVWGLDHQINYQWTFNERIDRLSAHSASYVAPLPWRHIVTIFGAVVSSDAAIDPAFALGGETAQLSGRYSIPLAKPEFLSRQGFEHELEFGYDYKYSTSNLEFGLAQVLASATDVHQFIAAYRATLRDGHGATSAGVTGFFSPGNFGGGNDDAAYALARAGAESSYFHGRIDLERLQILPRGFTVVARATGQFADGNLLPSEQLGFGGYASVRGYEENEAIVDRGILASVEVRAPAFSLLNRISRGGAPVGGDKFQWLAFWDSAHGGNIERLPGEARLISLSSIGPGFRWSFGDRFSMRFDYGFQLRESGMGLGFGDSRMHIGGTLAY
jgi:hemolysin activation/secretion protein